jgi:hypothetical protein
VAAFVFKTGPLWKQQAAIPTLNPAMRTVLNIFLIEHCPGYQRN